MPSASPTEDDPTAQRDLALMRSVQSGDLDAFRELVELHQNRVAGVIGRLVGSQFDHTELAHEVFVRVWKSADRYQPSARFTTWLLTITRNLVLNEIRYRSRHATVSIEPLEDEESAPRWEIRDPAAQRPDRAMEEAELQLAIERALAALPEAQRTAMHLRRYEGMAYEDIALVLETSVSSVKSLLFRARAQLKEALQEFLE
jgi:RNA polymerase sigma-70 factor (ECF subfamily)